MRWGQRTLHHLEQVSEFAQFTRVQVRNRPMNQLRREVSAHDSRLLRQRSHWFALPASFWKRAADTTIKAQAAWRIGSLHYCWPPF